MTQTSKKNNMISKQVFYIYYLIKFKKNNIKALINLNNKVNIMILNYIGKLNIKTYHTNYNTTAM